MNRGGHCFVLFLDDHYTINAVIFFRIRGAYIQEMNV